MGGRTIRPRRLAVVPRRGPGQWRMRWRELAYRCGGSAGIVVARMHAWRNSPASRFNPLAQAAGSPRSGEDCTPWTCRCVVARVGGDVILWERRSRSEEHTSEIQSIMRISYDVLCLTK